MEIAQPIERFCDGSESDSRRVGVGELAVAGDEAAGSPGVDGKGFIHAESGEEQRGLVVPDIGSSGTSGNGGNKGEAGMGSDLFG